MENNLRVLIVAPIYPYPPLDGHTVRNYNLFRNISDGYSFDFLAFGESGADRHRERLLKQLGPCFQDIEIVPESTLKRVEIKKGISKIVNLFFPYKIGLGLPYYSEAMAEAVERRAATNKYDLIFFCGFHMFLYFPQKQYHLPHIVDIVDSVSLLMRSYFHEEQRIWRKISCYLQYFWASRYETLHFATARNMISVSPIDMNSIRGRVPRSKMWVVPNGVDTDCLKADEKVPVKENSLLFTGVMDYPPNNQSAIYFVKEILPLVRSKIPGISLIIAGRNPTEELKDLVGEDPRITLTGYVEEMKPFFSEASLYVAPLVSGAGIKNKILEAWAMSKPVVATSMACNGLNAVHGRNVLIADTPADFAEAVISLLRSPAEREKIAAEGRKTAEVSYSWREQSLILDRIIREVIQAEQK